MKKMTTIKNRKLETSCDKLFRKKLEQEKENKLKRTFLIRKKIRKKIKKRKKSKRKKCLQFGHKICNNY
jgi:hypothetical protein